MNPVKSASPSSSGASSVHKRRRKTMTEDGPGTLKTGDSPSERASPIAAGGGAGAAGSSGVGGSSSSFRNVSACNRCRLRKNRCDQRLPACMSCEKASVRCVGYDPITKREIPRSYVHYLETRVAYLEALLSNNNIPYPPAEEFPDLPPIPQPTSALSTPTTATALHPPPLPGPPLSPSQTPIDPALSEESGRPVSPTHAKQDAESRRDAIENNKLDNLVSDIGLVSFAGASDPRYLGSVSGISFARVVLAAVKSTSAGAKDEQAGNDLKKHRRITPASRGRGARPVLVAKEEPKDEDLDTQMRDSFFGLQTKPTISPAPFPSRQLAERLVNLYFEHANPQIPSLHRGEFGGVLDAIYGPSKVQSDPEQPVEYDVQGTSLGGSPRERYLLNIVCAIGAGIFLTGPDGLDAGLSEDEEAQDSPRKKQKTDSNYRKEKYKQYEPEAYHASAMLHLESFLGTSKGGLQELQAVLLLAGYALLRPVSPGLWYIVGVALRLAVDLGLHYEDAETEAKISASPEPKTEKQGKKEWKKDMRRRLWWCVYSLDRLVSTCVGRPFGIADEVISTQFPSLLDDEYIDPTKGLTPPPPGSELQSYKLVSHHYFRLRLLQSEILQVLQLQSHTFDFASASSEHAFKKDDYKGKENYPPHHPYHLQTPYLHRHKSLQAWHKDIDRRLKEWIESAPKSKAETGVAFSSEFLELNYWQAKIMLYRPCLSGPVLLGELGGSNGGPRSRAAESGFGGRNHTDKQRVEYEEHVYLVVAEAGSRVLKLYRQLHRVHQVNYTFLATHHLFMAGISFLYAIWHSPMVRLRLTMDDIDFTILAATSVLGDLVDVCPPAQACKEAFERMARATVQMCLAGKQGAISKVVPTGSTYQVGPQPQRQHIQQYQQPNFQHPQPQLQHQRIETPVTRPDSAESFSSAAHSSHSGSTATRKVPVHFDEGFRDLFTSPRQTHAMPTTSSYPPQQPYTPSPAPSVPVFHQPTQQQYPTTPLREQELFQQQGEMMIDPMLQSQRPTQEFPSQNELSTDWIDMNQFNVSNEWEVDSWSDEGSNQVEIFNEFFFGSGIGGGS